MKVPSGDLPGSLSHVPVAPVQVKASGDGCKNLKVIDAHGFMDETPVRAKLDVLGKRLALVVVNLESGATTTFRGTLETSFCSNDPTRLLELSGRMQATGAKPAPRLHFLLFEVMPFEQDERRLRIELRRDPNEAPVVSLWDTRPGKRALQLAYEKALGTSGDIEAVLEGPDGSVIVAYLTMGHRDLWRRSSGIAAYTQAPARDRARLRVPHR